jgi:hypothetical protein
LGLPSARIMGRGSCKFLRISSDLQSGVMVSQISTDLYFILDESYFLWFRLRLGMCRFSFGEVIIRVIMMLVQCLCGGRKCEHLSDLSELHD